MNHNSWSRKGYKAGIDKSNQVFNDMRFSLRDSIWCRFFGTAPSGFWTKRPQRFSQ